MQIIFSNLLVKLFKDSHYIKINILQNVCNLQLDQFPTSLLLIAIKFVFKYIIKTFISSIDLYFVLYPSADPYADLAAQFTDAIPEFHEHLDHVEFHTDAVPGPSNEKLESHLESEMYKRDESTEPSKLIYGQIKEK